MAAKRYYWLKLGNTYFSQLEQKKMRKQKDGMNMQVIYLRMMLLSIDKDGYIYYQGVYDSIEEELAEGTQGDQNGSGEAEPGQKPEKKYTDEDVDRIIAKKIAAERKRMSKLFNDEQQESELDKRERDVLKRELRADAKDTLTSQGLPSTLADLIDYSDKESSEKSLENVISIFREATAQGIKNALRGHAPRVGARLPGKDPIADAFAKKAR